MVAATGVVFWLEGMYDFQATDTKQQFTQKQPKKDVTGRGPIPHCLVRKILGGGEGPQAARSTQKLHHQQVVAFAFSEKIAYNQF
jgi:hypothetical protein